MEQRMHGTSGKRPSHRHVAWHRWRGWIAAACVAGMALMGGYLLAPHTQDVDMQYATLSGKSSLVLPDKSIVWLQTGSRLSYTTQQGDRRRQLVLEGEAFFEVARDEQHPFVVQADDLLITVHGTRFNVESYPDMEHTYVSLQNGSVSLQTAGERCQLSPGETAVYDKRNGTLTVSRDRDAAFASSWAQEQLLFEQRKLSEIVPLLSRWYHVRITLDPALADVRYTFTLRREPLEEILRLMRRIHAEINYQFDEGNELTIYSE
jgi:ferric-dicitrate binding protein FerR (iron transport regulator)